MFEYEKLFTETSVRGYLDRLCLEIKRRLNARGYDLEFVANSHNQSIVRMTSHHTTAIFTVECASDNQTISWRRVI